MDSKTEREVLMWGSLVVAVAALLVIPLFGLTPVVAGSNMFVASATSSTSIVNAFDNGCGVYRLPTYCVSGVAYYFYLNWPVILASLLVAIIASTECLYVVGLGLTDFNVPDINDAGEIETIETRLLRLKCSTIIIAMGFCVLYAVTIAGIMASINKANDIGAWLGVLFNYVIGAVVLLLALIVLVVAGQWFIDTNVAFAKRNLNLKEPSELEKKE